MHGTPVVFVARPPSGIAADCVLVDDFAGTKDATGRLIARGHSNIAFVGLPPRLWAGAERLRGFQAAMTEARLQTNKRFVRYQESDVKAAENTVRSLLGVPTPPTALFAANNRNMIGALRAASDLGSSIALAGFDDFELAECSACRSLSSPMTPSTWAARRRGYCSSGSVPTGQNFPLAG